MEIIEKYIEPDDFCTILYHLSNGWYVYYQGVTLIILRKAVT